MFITVNLGLEEENDTNCILNASSSLRSCWPFRTKKALSGKEFGMYAIHCTCNLNYFIILFLQGDREGECYLPSVSLPEIPVPIRARAEDVTSFSIAFSEYPWFNTGGLEVSSPPVKQFSKQVSPLADRCKTHQQYISAPGCSEWDPCLVVRLPGIGSQIAFVLRVPRLNCRE